MNMNKPELKLTIAEGEDGDNRRCFCALVEDDLGILARGSEINIAFWGRKVAEEFAREEGEGIKRRLESFRDRAVSIALAESLESECARRYDHLLGKIDAMHDGGMKRESVLAETRAMVGMLADALERSALETRMEPTDAYDGLIAEAILIRDARKSEMGAPPPGWGESKQVEPEEG